LKKRSAPIPPPGTQVIYGTLPHAPRNSQNLDISDIYVQQKAPDYSTLPHLRNNEQKGSTHHFDNKSYERFEPVMGHLSSFAGHKRSPSGDSIGRNISLGKNLQNFYVSDLILYYFY
jgi:Arf-GAP with SH3 domain, ANK repeat and PH domain-containing protein